jgi:polyisoprenoid-binding protein YceI
MTIPAGIHTFGPANATLAVKTGRTGAAAKAGHNLVIHVTAWEGTLELGPDPAQANLTLDADGTSLRVQEGTGGMQSLGEDDKASIQKSIDDDVLRRKDVRFRANEVQAADGSRIVVRGELELVGRVKPISFELTADDGRLTGSATVKQSEWGIKPYSTLFGALKVVDEVEVVIDAVLPAG